ncbi:HNH endonuclease signature motif containing protein, partial [Microbacterium sp.]|uniref:HNH endonuclease signature motif containing protein n=1 Tax=Microbacterium sp. TaxID=51671 RepID=UPI002E3414E0
PSVLVHAAHDRVTQLARATTRCHETDAPADLSSNDGAVEPCADDARTMDQRRADILFDLVLAADPVAHAAGDAAIRGNVSVTVPVLALIDDTVRDPFEATTLDGQSPIDIDTARMLAADAPGWDRILTHPITGAVLGVDRYRPSEEVRRHLRVRDQHCRFPGCRMPTRRCDADHTLDFALGGATTAENLANLCRRHHTLKHQTSWTVVQRPGGVLEWTSPTGAVYTDRPVSTVAFAPDPECEYASAPF